jgi:hypothetical protein
MQAKGRIFQRYSDVMCFAPTLHSPKIWRITSCESPDMLKSPGLGTAAIVSSRRISAMYSATLFELLFRAMTYS